MPISSSWSAIASLCVCWLVFEVAGSGVCKWSLGDSFVWLKVELKKGELMIVIDHLYSD